MVRELCKADPDVNAEDEEQNSMLRLAAVRGHEEVALVLCEAGGNVLARNKDDSSPL
jgi:ankyrin repeat protein